ncbi:MAG: hypothetical protein IIA61_14505 [Candidatus Marinimicrobia bacterium]|nr:hypothetical protein [Candidatus Neomarinimicrobiota bacterium]
MIPDDSQLEKAIDVGAFVSAVIPIPWLAPAVSSVLTGISNRRKAERVHEVLKQLNYDLGTFKSEASETYVKSDEFEELLERTLSQAANERNKAKRSMYGRFLAGVIQSPGEPYDEQIRFLRDLETLQADNIRILRAMMQEPDPKSNIYTSSTFTTLSERLSDIPEARLKELVTQISEKRIVSGVGNTMVSGEIFNRCRETEFNSLQATFGYLIFT